jgi:hypothetical protein
LRFYYRGVSAPWWLWLLVLPVVIMLRLFAQATLALGRQLAARQAESADPHLVH